MKNTRERNIIYTQQYHTACGELILGAANGRLCLCDWTAAKHHNTVRERLQKALYADCTEQKTEITEEAAKQLEQYFEGKRTRFDIPLLLIGTDFQQKVWEKLREIPYGETRSYAELAQEAGVPKGIRAVANATGANALSIFIPCHRIIGSNHSLTGYAGGLRAKEFLIKLESLTLLDRQRGQNAF